MIPNFKSSNFAGGLQAAIDQIAKIFKINNANNEKIENKEKSEGHPFLVLVLLIYLPVCIILQYAIKSFIKRYAIIFIIGISSIYPVTHNLTLTLILSIAFPFLILTNLSGFGSSSSGGFSGGGGGGGFSGGGSSGSW